MHTHCLYLTLCIEQWNSHICYTSSSAFWSSVNQSGAFRLRLKGSTVFGISKSTIKVRSCCFRFQPLILGKTLGFWMLCLFNLKMKRRNLFFKEVFALIHFKLFRESSVKSFISTYLVLLFIVKEAVKIIQRTVFVELKLNSVNIKFSPILNERHSLNWHELAKLSRSRKALRFYN